MAPNNSPLHPAATFNNHGFYKLSRYLRYLKYFHNRPLYPSFPIQPSAFRKYDLDIPSLIHKVGWDSLFENQRFNQCPEGVRMFYASLKRGPGSSPTFFTTVVYNHEIKVTASLMAQTLDLPCLGSSAATNDDFASIVFDFGSAMESLTHDIGRYYPSMLSAGRLADRFKVLHFFITRILLPRSISPNELVHPADAWIMANARDGIQLNFSALMFAHMINYGDENYSSPLPFGPQITRLLHRIGIDLRDKLIVCDVREDLRAQHILTRVDAQVGRRKPVICSGGESADTLAYVEAAPATSNGQLVPALLEVVSTVLDRITAIKRKELIGLEFHHAQIKRAKESASSTSQDEETEGISDYESPPEYDF
ncbi:unnamed protein product [Linum tenue]|uniref:Uncharacterized protein n=1 Tax=Linum tenue TaxID=586396 RepID=A0AAV0HKN8_9ROSI|nr:unnamed protein product [Linum tenue]